MRTLRFFQPLALALAAAFVAFFTAAGSVQAFCGFYVSGADGKLFNDATQVVIMREGQRTVLAMENSYQGPPENFALVVPVPVVLQKENVKTLPKALFARVDELAAPRLVEYWEEDPCAMNPMAVGGAFGGAPPPSPMRARVMSAQDLGVTIEAQFSVGEYDVVVLGAKDSGGLDTWLRQENYKIPAGSEPYFRPYVQRGSKFFVAKVDVSKVQFDKGVATLSPLRFHYDSESFSLPIRLGLVNANGAQDLIVHILARGHRYEVANYPNVTIPTNFDVAEEARDKFGTFYAALFDRTIEKNPKAVVTEYAWDASTCDPCPSPALSLNELATLGADVLPSTANDASPLPPRGAGMSKPPLNGMPVRRLRFSSGFVLTRLHARYTKESLGEDLVFQEAAPISGGREVWTAPGQLEHGSQPAGTNNFQGRYAIRHPWTGAMTCDHPMRDRWGGPPGGALPAAKPATNSAFAPRGTVALTSFVKASVPELGATPTTPTTAASAGDASDSTNAGSATPGVAPKAGAHGCGACAMAEDGAGRGAATLVGMAALVTLFGRRRGRRRG